MTQNTTLELDEKQAMARIAAYINDAPEIGKAYLLGVAQGLSVKKEDEKKDATSEND